MKISEVEKITGLTAKAIRLYEEKGLIFVERENNLYRNYDENTVEQLKFIRILRDMGVSLSQICLHFNGVITFEELLNNRKSEMEKEKIFQQESYNKCIDFIQNLNLNTKKIHHTTGIINSSDVILGLDIGTTNISTVIIDYNSGEILETYVVANTSKISSENDFAEFDADWILNKSKRMIDYLIIAYPNTKSIGITGQMHGVIYIAKDGKAVSPLYNWQDGRGNKKFSKTKTYCEEIFSRTGYICSSGYAFATMFYNNINHIEPNSANSFCGITDYIVMNLTSKKIPIIHPSNAAAFGLYDLENNQFDKIAVEKLALSHYHLPEIAYKSDVAGYYKNIPVSVAIGDNQASFFGSVKEEKTSVLVNFGTGSQISLVADNFQKTSSGIEIRPYLFGKYLICGSALCGGKAYAIIEKFFSEYVKFLTNKSDSQFETMNKLAEEAYQNNNPLLVSTQFCGTRQKPHLRGFISEIDDVNFTPGNLILGVIHGMVNELNEYFRHIQHHDITTLVASGNAIKRNIVLQKVLKNTFKTKVVLTHSDEEAAIGSALYAGVVCSVIQTCQAKKIIREKTNDE